MANDKNDRTVELRSGGKMPLLGFGTFQVAAQDARGVVRDGSILGTAILTPPPVTPTRNLSGLR